MIKWYVSIFFFFKKTTTTTTTTTTTKSSATATVKGRCGKKYGNSKCPAGECCSKHGWCGKTEDHCLPSKGCQSEFGECSKEKTSTTTTTTKTTTTATTKTTTTTTKTSATATVKGRCGKNYGNSKCLAGECCSKYGWCGKTEDYCLPTKGCQSEFGERSKGKTSTTTRTTKTTTTTTTTTTKTPTTTSVTGKCGKEYGKCPSGQCCSKYGWCGKSDEYCAPSKGCQSELENVLMKMKVNVVKDMENVHLDNVVVNMDGVVQPQAIVNPVVKVNMENVNKISKNSK